MLIQKKLKTRKITLQKNLTQKPPVINAVPDQIKQVILNMLSNAEQAIPKEGGQIKISSKLLKTRINIDIYDSGTGIKNKDLVSVFEPFFTTKAIKGTGLGLSVSYGIIKEHGGEIRVKSLPGKGTTFTITLPI